MSFAAEASLLSHDTTELAASECLPLITMKRSLLERTADISFLLALVFRVILYGSNPCPTAPRRRCSILLVDRTVMVLGSPNTSRGEPHKTQHKIHHFQQHHHLPPFLYFLDRKMAPAPVYEEFHNVNKQFHNTSKHFCNVSKHFHTASKQCHNASKHFYDTNKNIHNVSEQFRGVNKTFRNMSTYLHTVRKHLHDTSKQFYNRSKQLHDLSKPLHNASKTFHNVAEQNTIYWAQQGCPSFKHVKKAL